MSLLKSLPAMLAQPACHYCQAGRLSEKNTVAR